MIGIKSTHLLSSSCGYGKSRHTVAGPPLPVSCRCNQGTGPGSLTRSHQGIFVLFCFFIKVLLGQNLHPHSLIWLLTGHSLLTGVGEQRALLLVTCTLHATLEFSPYGSVQRGSLYLGSQRNTSKMEVTTFNVISEMILSFTLFLEINTQVQSTLSGRYQQCKHPEVS